VCFVGTEITPSDGQVFVGGHVSTVVRLSKGLSSLGWQVHIVTTPSRFLEGAKFDFPWAKIHSIKVSGKYSSLRYGASFLIKVSKKIETLNPSESFDIIHTHSGFFSIAAIAVFLKKRLGIPALHSLYCPASFFPTEVISDRWIIRILSAGLDKTIAVSNNVRNSLMECGVSEDKIETIPLCVDTDVFNSSISSAGTARPMKAGSGTRMVLFVGNVSKIKGLDIFLRAAELVLRRYRGVEFVITLHEPYETIEKFRVIASGKLGSHVTVLGVVRSMPRLIASADVVVAPFRGTRNVSDIPLVVLEAMSIGKPVVASRIGGITEAVRHGENGVLVEPGRADELADAIVGLLNDPNLRKEMSERASSFVRHRFSCIEISRRLSDVYLEVISGAK